MGAAEQLPLIAPTASRWVNTLHLAPDGFCPQCGVAVNVCLVLPRIRGVQLTRRGEGFVGEGGTVVAEWRGCEDCHAELMAENKAKRGRR